MQQAGPHTRSIAEEALLSKRLCVREDFVSRRERQSTLCLVSTHEVTSTCVYCDDSLQLELSAKSRFTLSQASHAKIIELRGTEYEKELYRVGKCQCDRRGAQHEAGLCALYPFPFLSPWRCAAFK